jgi:rubrerythrin
MADFDIERFVSMSRAVDLSDIDWDEARAVGLTDDEHRVLRFMADTESHTIIYLRDLLAGHTAADPEVQAFMSCWVYEETHHGRALDRFMAEAGRAPEKNRYHAVTAKFSFREELTGVMSRGAAVLSPHFAAAHMCWGATNELTAAASYMALARKTKNRPLATLLTKLAKDERKHFAFYYSQSERRLLAGGWKARFWCNWAMGSFWKPVGIGVGDARTLEMIASFLFGDERGKKDLADADATIRRLPGMHWWNGVTKWIDDAREWYRVNHPADYLRHRADDRAADSIRPAAEANRASA